MYKSFKESVKPGTITGVNHILQTRKNPKGTLCRLLGFMLIRRGESFLLFYVHYFDASCFPSSYASFMTLVNMDRNG